MGGNSEETYEEIVRGRKSIRGFLDKPVPQELLQEIVELACRAPSSFNNQCWHFTVVTGDPLDDIRQGNTEGILAGKPDSREFRKGGEIAEAHRHRQIEVAKQLFGEMEIARDDKEGRQDWVMRGFRQFDAPVSVVVSYDKELVGSDIAPFDCGAVTNALVNAAWSRGLGCVINSQGIMQSPVVREHAGIPDEEVIMICVAMGFPDPDFPANRVYTNRKPLEDTVRFVGF
ncbi:nitroreductase [Pacificimonas flava]|uniref:Nitroreductase n=2 Tax=Pacificimonas TaxID=1960290 RepID=A0A219B4G1_9SPHN|nr:MULTISPECIES: nitroreductase [Pacificimonas]MBZ6377263.1 nitroreductase [Pacificimonas aurantium]OWV33023.1 nitroreductase [Pacificimonas flava]